MSAPAPPTATATPAGRARRRRPVLLVLGVALVAVLALVVGVIVTAGRSPAAPGARQEPAAAPQNPADPLAARIAALQTQLTAVPDNAEGWGTLGLAYVQEARNTVNPSYYPKAEGALATSLELQPDGNAVALAGTAALRAAQHRFADALDLATRATAIDPANSEIYGIQADAFTQLGRYDDAAQAVQRMLDLRPGTPAFTRAEYVAELRGDLDQAREFMAQALGAASNPADRAFCEYYLAELAFTSGDPTGALTGVERGLVADPMSPDLLEGRAKSLAALGRTGEAVAAYAQLVVTVPQPNYLIEAGEYLESVGRGPEAQQNYRLFDAENALFEANGVLLDTDPTLFYADHGDPTKALRYGEAGIAIRPFVEMQDAYAWALHAAGRDAEALTWADKAASTGMRNALFFFHRGAILAALGRDAQARVDLTTALEINPYFSPRQVPVARQLLTRVGGGS